MANNDEIVIQRDPEIEKLIERDTELKFQKHIENYPDETKESLIEKFIVNLNGVNYEVVSFDGDYLHLFVILNIIWGFEDAKMLFLHIFEGDHKWAFIQFDIFNFKFLSKRVIAIFPERKAASDKFLSERVHTEIDRQCRFKFSIMTFKYHIAGAFTELADDLEMMFDNQLKGVSDNDREKMHHWVSHFMETEWHDTSNRIKKLRLPEDPEKSQKRTRTD